MKKNNITVVGAGYVGFSLALFLSKDNNVSILETDEDKISRINKGASPISDRSIDKYLSENDLNLYATKSSSAYKNADFIVIATPTNFDEIKNSFDTTIVESVIKSAITYNKDALIVIKSTIPIGFTSKLQQRHETKNIIFSPEFLREGHALEDCYFPSRILIGGNCNKSKSYANIVKSGSKQKNVKVLHMNSEEAESVKLFSNAYLALRVSFFNELDSFALTKKLNTKNIIEGMSHDPRIGSTYNNPSFGYGGYCLPKDTKELHRSFENIPQSIITSIIQSNEIRKNFIIDCILNKAPKIVGVYRLIMKSGSDNFRSTAVNDIINTLIDKNVKVVIHEPLISYSKNDKLTIINDVEEFKKISDIILCNRYNESLQDVRSKIFTRDIFGNN